MNAEPPSKSKHSRKGLIFLAIGGALALVGLFTGSYGWMLLGLLLAAIATIWRPFPTDERGTDPQ